MQFPPEGRSWGDGLKQDLWYGRTAVRMAAAGTEVERMPESHAREGSAGVRCGGGLQPIDIAAVAVTDEEQVKQYQVEGEALGLLCEPILIGISHDNNQARKLAQGRLASGGGAAFADGQSAGSGR